MKSLLNFGLIKTIVLVKVGLMSSKDFLASTIHFMVESFFNIFFSDLTNSARLELNLLRKLIFPQKACNYPVFLGCCICKMASILEGSIRIPSFEIIFPNSFPSSNPDKDFLGFKEIPYFLHLMKTCLR